MSIENNNNNNNQFEIPLKLSNALEESGIIQKFVIDPNDKYVKLRLNSKYIPVISLDVSTEIIKEKDGWTKFTNKFRNELKPYKIDKDHENWIVSNVTDNGELIRSIARSTRTNDNNNHNNNNSATNTNEQQQNNNILSDLSDQSDETKNNKNNQEEQNHQNDIPVLGVLQAIRTLVEGRIKVIGRIVGRSTNFKVITRSEMKCKNLECPNNSTLDFYPPRRDIPKRLDTSTGTNANCWECETYSLDIKHEYQIAKKIQLEDIDTIVEKFDRLNVIMYGDSSDKIIDGEIVEIEGDLITQKMTASGINSNNGSNKMLNVLHSDKPIIYKNRKEIKNTQKDIDNIYRWKKICNETYKKELETVNRFKDVKREDRPEWVKNITPMTFEQRVTILFAPNVYGHSDAKMGILRSLIGGSKKENSVDNGRRGRIHTNLIGDPGTAKTALSIESTKLDQNSRLVDASGASGKSLIGIVDKENDSLMVKYGVVVAAKNSHVVINEASFLTYDDQAHLIGIGEEGKTTLDKWGEHIPIDAPTTLIFTTNPLGTKWESQKLSKDKMVVIRQNLLDRIDQTYGFFDAQTEEEMEEFADELDKIGNRKPHNYTFLTKFLQYAKTIEPEFVGTTNYRLKRFWINAKIKKVASNRSFFSIKRIAEAQAKLNLSSVVDDFIAKKTMESLTLMYNQYGALIEQIQNPRDLTVEVFYNILKENDGGGVAYTIRELCKKASEKNKQVSTYLKNKWDLESNRELKNIIDMVEQKENVKVVGFRPKTLVYYNNTSNNDSSLPSTSSTNTTTSLSDLSDQSDKPQGEINEKNNKKIDNESLTTLSDRSERSDSTDKLVGISTKTPPIAMTNEQFDAWFGKQENEEGKSDKAN
jgi:DNA replicative helicase MCM subunit Mcm2 (Cdc46/Mcm family)